MHSCIFTCVLILFLARLESLIIVNRYDLSRPEIESKVRMHHINHNIIAHIWNSTTYT